MGEYVKKKKDMSFQSVESLQQVVNVVNEAAAAVNDKSRTIRESAIPEACVTLKSTRPGPHPKPKHVRNVSHEHQKRNPARLLRPV